MLGNGPLWATAAACHRVLDAAGIPHAIVGGVAVCLHGYQRNTIDIDILVRREDAEGIRAVLLANGLAWDAEACEFRSKEGVPVQFLTAGDKAGQGMEIVLPDPAADGVRVTIEGLPVIRLSGLIEAKIACGEANVRRTHRDFADVVELIARHGLDGSFARHLHKAVRPTFRRLVRHVR